MKKSPLLVLRDSFKIKCWTDGKFIAFLFANGRELSKTKVNVYIDGFRFA